MFKECIVAIIELSTDEINICNHRMFAVAPCLSAMAACLFAMTVRLSATPFLSFPFASVAFLLIDIEFACSALSLFFSMLNS